MWQQLRPPSRNLQISQTVVTIFLGLEITKTKPFQMVAQACSFNNHYRVYQIYEVFICLDKWNLLPIPCPDAATYRTNCMTPYVLFPEFIPLPPRSPLVGHCTDPNSLACYESNPSDEENLESHLERKPTISSRRC